MLAKSLELSPSAISHYLDIFEGVLLIRRLQPYYANIRKRLVKSPKLYIRDTGLLHRLAGLTDEASLERWPNRGNSFEGLVIEELMTAGLYNLTAPRFYFYRTQAGAEVDLLIQSGQQIWPVEIKLGIDVRHYDTVGLVRTRYRAVRDRLSKLTSKGTIGAIGTDLHDPHRRYFLTVTSAQ